MGTPATSPAVTAMVNPSPNCPAERCTVRTKYNGILTTSNPNPNMLIRVANAYTRRGPGCGTNEPSTRTGLHPHTTTPPTTTTTYQHHHHHTNPPTHLRNCLARHELLLRQAPATRRQLRPRAGADGYGSDVRRCRLAFYERLELIPDSVGDLDLTALFGLSGRCVAPLAR